MHLVNAVVTRALVFVPLYVLGFAPPAVYAYLVFVSFHAVFIHANVRFPLRAAGARAGHAAVPPLASRRGRRGGRHELPPCTCR
jgi:hypothetical protein